MNIPADKILVFSLTTCPYCKAVRRFLKEHNADFLYIEVDDLSDDDYAQAMEIVIKHNPKKSFPTIVFGKTGEAVIGLEKEHLAEALQKMQG